MPTYVLLGKATEMGSGNILTFGSEGASSFNELIDRVGGRLLSQFVVTGQYDIVAIVDFETEIGSLALSLRAEAGGIYIEALRAFSPDDVDEARSLLPDVEQLRTELLEDEQG